MNDPEIPRVAKLSDRDFTLGLLSSLLLRGTTSISTIDGQHQQRFRRVIEVVNGRIAEGDKSVTRMPKFFPGPITGEFYEFDEQLIRLQDIEVTQCIGPYFVEVSLVESVERASKRLERKFEPEERQLFDDLAAAFTS